MRRFVACIAVAFGCSHPKAVPTAPLAANAVPATSGHPTGVLVFAASGDRTRDLTWIDLATNQRGTVSRDPDSRAHIVYVRDHGGIKATTVLRSLGYTKPGSRWSVIEDPERRERGTLCVREATATSVHCFVLPVVEGVGRMSELDDGTIVVASWPGPRYPVWRIDPAKETVTDLGVVLGPPIATPHWIAWHSDGEKIATVFVRPLADDNALVRSIQLGEADIDECEVIAGRPDAALCRTYASKALHGRGLFLVDLAAGTKHTIALSSDRDTALSPDGNWIAYAVSDTNADDSRVPQRIMVKSLDGGEARTITLRAEAGQEVIAWIP